MKLNDTIKTAKKGLLVAAFALAVTAEQGCYVGRGYYHSHYHAPHGYIHHGHRR